MATTMKADMKPDPMRTRRGFLGNTTLTALAGAAGAFTLPARSRANTSSAASWPADEPWVFDWREAAGRRTFRARLVRVRGYEVELDTGNRRVTMDARRFAEPDQRRIEWFQTRGRVVPWTPPAGASGDEVGGLEPLEYRRFPDGGENAGLPSWLHRWRSPGRLRFLLHVPQAAREGRACPLLVWLHGNDGRGGDNRRQLEDGGGAVRRLFADDWQRWQPCFVLVPQSDPNDGPDNVWLSADQVLPHRALMMTVQCIDVLRAERWPTIDSRKLWVAGLSSGGIGAFEAASKFPGRFAAAVPIACSYPPERFWPGNALPLWMFLNRQDRAVDLEEAEALVRHLRSLRQDARVTRFGGAGHDAWTRALSEMDFRRWLGRRERAIERYPSDVTVQVTE